MEELILESMAWRHQSPLWNQLKEQPIPSCEDVSLPSQLQPQTPSATNNAHSDVGKSTPQQQSIPYSPSTYVTNKRAETSLAACNVLIINLILCKTLILFSFSFASISCFVIGTVS